jgi:carboxypeptidase Q
MRQAWLAGLGAVTMLTLAGAASAQTFATEDPVIRRIWQLGMEQSHAPKLAQTLLDSIGGRLTGTPALNGGHDWLVKMYTSWGIPAAKEQYGTWAGWRRGFTHIDMIAPRARTLEGTMLGWSAGTRGPVEGAVILFPDVKSPQEFDAWLPQAKGRFVAFDMAQPTCRPDREWQEFGATPGGGGGRGGFGGRGGTAEGPDTLSSFGRMRFHRAEAQSEWGARIRAAAGAQGNASTSPLGSLVQGLRTKIENAGAAGILQSNWSNDFGVNKVFTTNTRRIPTLDLSCEDYGLIVRMAENNQGPRLRVDAQSEFLGEIPTFNTIAQIKGSQLPNEYVMLSSHFDSFDSSSGATDNGTGTITMLEAMRILKQAYPNPKRTIIAGHWSSEEQGLNGSRAWAHDHPEVVEGLQALFNQDNGTGRVVSIGMGGLLDAGRHFGDWMSKIPSEISGQINLSFPGGPAGGGSDNASFACFGAPAFGLGALGWDYGTITWHTNRDTYDKLVMDDLENNATLTAMLVYLASEGDRITRERRVMPTGRGGQPQQWPECQDGARKAPGGN